jgi:2,2-dialkylglycine decarboxylase (pyruvate)
MNETFGLLSEAELLNDAREYVLRARLDKGDVSGPVLVWGEGSIVCDVSGKSYLDFNSGQMCSALGHRFPRVVDAIRQACDRLIHASSSFYNVEELTLAKKLASISVPPLKRSFFMESGSDANEAAMEIARIYTGRYEIASPHTGFHGLSGFTRSVTFGTQSWRRGHGPYMPGTYAFMAPYCHRCPIGLKFPECRTVCLDGAFEVLDAQMEDRLAAVITEPLFSAGGVIEPPSGWLADLKRKCEERGALLILDEAQTGLGKLGTMWGFEQHGVVPDIVTVSKHFGGGISISAIITTDKIADAVQEKGFIFGHSHSSDPLACAAASATIDTIVSEDLPRKATILGKSLRIRLEKLAKRHPVIVDIRGRGLLQGLELETRPTAPGLPRGIGFDLEKACVANGLLLSVRRNGSVLRFVPPWTTTEEQFDLAADILEAAFDSVLS